VVCGLTTHSLFIDCCVQCMSRQDFCIMSNIEASSSVMDSKVVSMTTVNVGPLLPLPGNEPAAAAVSLGDSDDEQVASSCSKDAPVVVEGVGFTVVIVIAFAAFVIGVMLMSSLWFIYVKTSTLPPASFNNLMYFVTLLFLLACTRVA